jgi:cytochrome c biogenesis protein CcmG/thiol:disulfide interchange protein DsbE
MTAQSERRSTQRIVAGVIAAVLFLAFIGLLAYGLMNREPPTAASGEQRPGKPAPAFTLATLDGQQVNLADFAGRPVVINFWASWCAPCRVEMPHLIAAFDRHEGAGVVFIGIDVQDTMQDAEAFVQEFEVPTDRGYLIVTDPNGQTMIDYGVAGLPATFFIDRNGVVQRRHVGAVNGQVLEDNIALISQTMTSSLPDQSAAR